MEQTTTVISPQALQRQWEFCHQISEFNSARGKQPLALVDTYGCQQNEADSERLRGWLEQMGYRFTQREEEADVIVLNTCAVREHAEDRVFGNVGALVHIKRRRPSQIICLCGCMMQQPKVAQRIRETYRHVDLVFGPHALWRFPELLWQTLSRRVRVFDIADEPGSVCEGIPQVRQSRVTAWGPILPAGNNFRTTSIVPYVRGRERSRRPEDILQEVEQLVRQGVREITLLGQNVNSYGKDLPEDVDFSWLLEQINAVEGEFLIRFMTSHPKDATERLFDTMARCSKVAPAIHLPFQAGNDRVLKAMNRGYTSQGYLDKVAALRARIPHIVLTSDVIVGCPGETTAEFEDTLALISQVEYDALFTFIYSPRQGTPAASMPDPLPMEEKKANFQRLLQVQNEISSRKHHDYIGKTLRCLVDGEGQDPRNNLTARTPGNRLVHLTGEKELVGRFVPLTITGATTWALFGELNEEETLWQKP
ncbi:MAG: tRNA (N6-isopentenyl adenosine(37)-C2)-methylthiotransferase MiaB [Oscillospiraceae bacterium]|nr:tRNA (N6-isopentenyl adenosine(37)-C2)-methylthiotransferase MiaB [Oscillospiraceae bacterium]